MDKLDANSYMTWMEGRKFKVAHKRAGNNAWNASERTRRKKVIQYLQQMIEELKQADASADLPYSLGEHDHVYGLSLRTKDELLATAKDYGIPVTSGMKREELLNAVKARLDLSEHGGEPTRGVHTNDDRQGREIAEQKADGVKAPRSLSRDAESPGVASPDALAQLQSKTKDDLYKLAGEHHINGRSNMNKAELMNALASEIGCSGARTGV